MQRYGFLALAVVTSFAGCDQFALKPNSPAPATSAAPAASTQTEVAGVGSGIEGRSLDKPGVVDAIARPAKSYFAGKENIVFNVQVPEALKLYKALEGEGKGPASHEEFMEKVIEANRISLPTLPPGRIYVYDPETELLMVHKSAK